MRLRIRRYTLIFMDTREKRKDKAMKFTRTTKTQFVLKVNTDATAFDPSELEKVFAGIVEQLRAKANTAGPAINGDGKNVGEWSIYAN